jgi:OOP family OmpA-OmpF porin
MKSTKVFSTIMGLALVLLFGLSELKAQKGLYFGGSIGPSFVNKKIAEIGIDDIKIDGKDMAYKIYAGYKLPAFLALEGGYRNLGKISSDISEHNSSGWDLNAKANLTLGPVQFFGKAGAFFNNVKVTFQDPIHPEINENNTKFMFGFGAGLNIERLGLRAEWESLDISKGSNVSMLTAGITYRLAGGN